MFFFFFFNTKAQGNMCLFLDILTLVKSGNMKFYYKSNGYDGPGLVLN